MVVDLSEIKGKQKKNEFETISLKRFNKMNRKDEYCFELNDERVTDDIEYFFYENDVKEDEQEKRINKAKHIKVFKISKYVFNKELFDLKVKETLMSRKFFKVFDSPITDFAGKIIGEDA